MSEETDTTNERPHIPAIRADAIHARCLVIDDKERRPRWILDTNPTGAPGIHFLDAARKPRLTVRLDRTGSPVIDLADEAGDTVIAITVCDGRPQILYRPQPGSKQVDLVAMVTEHRAIDQLIGRILASLSNLGILPSILMSDDLGEAAERLADRLGQSETGDDSFPRRPRNLRN